MLWSHVLESLRRACPALQVSCEPEQGGAARILDAFLPDLANGLAEQDDVALVLDDFHRLSGASREGVAWLVEHAPPSFQLVISTRIEPALPMAALRAHGELLELRADELAFSAAEADVFLNERLGLGLGIDDIDKLVERTEGWPAGLYLAALSIRGAEDRRALIESFDGNSRGVIDFLVDEVLDAHDPAMQTLMLRCSILERLCGPFCDALLEEEGSAHQLRELARTNLFLVPLDDNGHWYRFHHLFATLLRAELEHREPGLAPMLHRRLDQWHHDQRSADKAPKPAAGAVDSSESRSSRGGGELSDRELTVLRALTGPLSERDIGRELFLSHNTVHSHTRSIYRKLGVSSRTEAVGRARERGLL